MTKPLISVVVPFYNEAENASALASRFRELVDLHPDADLEFVAVDDGSTDDGVNRLLAEAGSDLNLTVVKLSRNFGSHQAVTAGLDHAQGVCAIVTGADLQEPVDLIAQFLAAYRNGFDVVWGIRASRARRGVGTAVSKAFSMLFHRYSEIKSYPAEGPSGVLVTRAVLDQLAELRERNRNVYGLIAWLGFRSTEVRYEQQPRRAGSSKWTRRGLARLAVDSFVEFSSAPLKFATAIGSLVAGLGFVYALVLGVRAMWVGTAPEGWTTVTVLVLAIGGIQLLMIGIIGEYLWRATDEARRRPPYVIKQVLRPQEPR